MIIDKKELEKALREGGDLDIIKDTLLATIDTIANKIKQENKTSDKTENEPAPAPESTREETKQTSSGDSDPIVLDTGSFIKELSNQKETRDKKQGQEDRDKNSSENAVEGTKSNLKDADSAYAYWDIFEQIVNELKNEQKQKEVGGEQLGTLQGSSSEDITEREPLPSHENSTNSIFVNDKAVPALSSDKDKNQVKNAETDDLEKEKKHLLDLLNSLGKNVHEENKPAEPVQKDEKTEPARQKTSEISDKETELLNEFAQLIVDYYDSHSNQQKQEKKKKAGTSYVTDKGTPPAYTINLTNPIDFLDLLYPLRKDLLSPTFPSLFRWFI